MKMANNTGNESLLWVQCYPNLLLGLFICDIIGFVSAVFGILGNVASIIVLVQPSMMSSTSILLAAMAAYDTLLLTAVLFLFAEDIISAFKKHGDSEYRFFSLNVLIVSISALKIAHTGTIYTTVMVTIERAVVVVFPLKAKLVCTKTKASVACVAVFLWSLIYNVPHFIVFYQLNYYDRNDTSFEDFGSGYFYRYICFLYLTTAFHVVLPFVVIIILNVAITQRLCTRGKRIIHQVSSRGDNQTQLTVMIIVLTGIFCARWVMVMADFFVAYHESTYKQSEKRNATEQEFVFLCPSAIIIVDRVTYIIIILNSATNFIVYIFCGHKFRRCLHELCCSRHCLQAHRSSPEIQTPLKNPLSTSTSSLHLKVLQDRQRSNSPARTSALLAVPETGC